MEQFKVGNKVRDKNWSDKTEWYIADAIGPEYLYFHETEVNIGCIRLVNAEHYQEPRKPLLVDGWGDTDFTGYENRVPFAEKFKPGDMVIQEYVSGILLKFEKGNFTCTDGGWFCGSDPLSEYSTNQKELSPALPNGWLKEDFDGEWVKAKRDKQNFRLWFVKSGLLWFHINEAGDEVFAGYTQASLINNFLPDRTPGLTPPNIRGW